MYKTNSIEKNLAEFWKVLRSTEDEGEDQHDGMEELLININNLTKHIQDQGKYSHGNIEFENEINDKLKLWFKVLL